LFAQPAVVVIVNVIVSVVGVLFMVVIILRALNNFHSCNVLLSLNGK